MFILLVSVINTIIELVMIWFMVLEFRKYIKGSNNIYEFVRKVIIPESVWTICLDVDAVIAPVELETRSINLAVTMTILCLLQILYLLIRNKIK